MGRYQCRELLRWWLKLWHQSVAIRAIGPRQMIGVEGHDDATTRKQLVDSPADDGGDDDDGGD